MQALSRRNQPTGGMGLPPTARPTAGRGGPRGTRPRSQRRSGPGGRPCAPALSPMPGSSCCPRAARRRDGHGERSRAGQACRDPAGVLDIRLEDLPQGRRVLRPQVDDEILSVKGEADALGTVAAVNVVNDYYLFHRSSVRCTIDPYLGNSKYPTRPDVPSHSGPILPAPARQPVPTRPRLPAAQRAACRGQRGIVVLQVLRPVQSRPTAASGIGPGSVTWSRAGG